MTLSDRSRPAHRTRPASSPIPLGSPVGSKTGSPSRAPRRIAVGDAQTSPPASLASPAQPITLNAVPWNVFAREQAFAAREQAFVPPAPPVPPALPATPAEATSAASAAPPVRLRVIPGGAPAAARTTRPATRRLSRSFWLDWAPMLLLGLAALATGLLSILHALTR